MQRRKFVIGMGALASGAAAGIGTGAFDTVEAERAVSVSTTGDASAYLGLTGDDDYVTDNSDGDSMLTIDLGGPSNSDENLGSGFNKNAETTVHKVVTITNQGTQPVSISVNNNDVQPAINFWVSAEDSGNDPNDLAAGEKVYLNVTVDDLNDGGLDKDEDDNLVINAIDTDNSS